MVTVLPSGPQQAPHAARAHVVCGLRPTEVPPVSAPENLRARASSPAQREGQRAKRIQDTLTVLRQRKGSFCTFSC